MSARSEPDHVDGDSCSVRVFLRLRPMDKLETSKRSKDCIELHDNPKIITVDSPLLGVFDYTFDQVFDEYTPQVEVYRETVSPVPRKLLDGFNCSVIAYGQSGTGKSYTMTGEGLGTDLVSGPPGNGSDNHNDARPFARSRGGKSGQDLHNLQAKDLDTEGMIPRVVFDVFRLAANTPDHIEFMVRCSYVEIYLEKMSDLLQPWREGICIGKDEHGEACVVGASEICCMTPADVYSLLARGNAYRTKSAADNNRDSNRSHAVFTLRIEQNDSATGKRLSSRLLMVDLAGSEIGKSKSTRTQDSAVGLEGRMINASLASLQNVIRGTLAEQGKEKARFNPRAYANSSKLAKLLQRCFGGNWHTTVLCTGSPSSYNIGETINSIKFGQQARQITNRLIRRDPISTTTCQARLSKAEERISKLTSLLHIFADECKAIKETGASKYDDSCGVWAAIDKISSDGGVDDQDFVIQQKVGNNKSTSGDGRMSQEELELKLSEQRQAREKAESAVRDMKSDLASLRSQNETLRKEKLKLERDLVDSKEEIKSLSTSKAEVDHLLRTSQFRENEAILFLRQFRTFYFRLLKNKAAHGSGGTREITDEMSKKIPGVSDLADLLDVDKVMVESGIIEQAEIGTDTSSPDYFPSNDAVSASTAEAEKAEEREFELIKGLHGAEGGGTSILNTQKSSQWSFGQLTAYRQKLLKTPAGRLAIQKELELERELAELAKKCVSLQNAVIAEKAMVENLSARQGAMSKMKSAQELSILKQELERKTNDFQFIVWKMNEMHLVNKTIFTKVENREQHVTYLEEHLLDLQTRNRRLVIDRQEAEKKMRDETSSLKNQLEGLSVKMWQLGDPAPHLLPSWRLLLPYSGEKLDLADFGNSERRISLGSVADDVISGVVEAAS